MSKKLSSRGQIAIRFEHKGDFKNLRGMLMSATRFKNKLDIYGKRGVDALREATPKDTGLTSESWSYKIYDNMEENGTLRIIWYNSNVDEIGRPIAVLIQYGHATRNGGYVEGIDYINPAMAPIFEDMAKEIWKEVVNTRGKRH